MTKRLFRASDAYLISFLIPVISMLVIFIGRGIFPFGEESFLRTDMYHQYAPFFSELQSKLRNGGSLLYSWNIGMGVNFTALYGYYLASPLNFLLLLVPKRFVLEFMSYMVVLKIGLCGVSATAFFRHHYGSRDFGCAFFGVLYAMSGYISAYSWNIMWLDCIILFPLILIGAEKLLRLESPLLYTVTLGLSILSNYYISIMICLFLLLYFFVLELMRDRDERKDFFRRALRFGIFSIIAGGLAAVTLIPEIYAIKATASGNVSFPDTISQYFTIIDMAARHLPNVETEQGLKHWPNIYCGVAVLLLLPLYFMNRKIELKEKLLSLSLMLFFYLSFSVNVLNFIWHGFHYPNSLPARQSFIYILLVLSMAYHSYINRRYLRVRELQRACTMAILFVVLLQKLITEESFHWSVFYIAIVLILIYFGLLYTEKRSRRRSNMLMLMLLVVLTGETALNMAVTSVSTTGRSSYISDNEDVRKLVNAVQREDRGLYRFEKLSRKTKNDGAWMNFPSVSIFSSTAYKHGSDLFRRLGMEASTNAYSITGSTPLMDMLLSVRYGIYTGEQENTDARELDYISASGNTYIYRRRNTLPVGFFMKEEELDAVRMDAGSPALVQNSFAEAVGEGAVLHTRLGSFEGEDYVFTADEPGEYYAYVNKQKIKKLKAYLPDSEKSFDNVDRGYMLELGYIPQGAEVRLHSETKGQSMDATVYRFDMGTLERICRKLGKYTWELDILKDSQLKGRITAPSEGVLFTSILYDPGWAVFLDGVKTEPVLIEDSLLGVRLSPGEHTVELRFFPGGLMAGAILSGISLVIVAAMLIYLRLYGTPLNNNGGRRPREGRRLKLSKGQQASRETEKKPGRSRRRQHPQKEEAADERPNKILRMQGRTEKEWDRAFIIPEIGRGQEIQVPDIRAMEARSVAEKLSRIPRERKAVEESGADRDRSRTEEEEK